MLPANKNKVVSKIINGKYSVNKIPSNPAAVEDAPSSRVQGIRKHSDHSVITLPKFLWQRTGDNKGPSAVESKSPINGIVHQIDN